MFVYAQCPLCIITTSGGLAIANVLGLPPIITGIWIGGINMALAYSVASKSRRRYLSNPFLWSAVFLLFNYFFLVITKQVDLVVAGMVIGTIGYISGKYLEEFLRKKNNDVAYFPGQRIVMPSLVLFSLSIVASLFH